jgi:hypothetical protein
MLGINDSGYLLECGGKVIRNKEHLRCGDTQLPETLLGRHPEDPPSLVPTSAGDLDSHVRIAADEEEIRKVTFKWHLRKNVDSEGKSDLALPASVVALR